MKIACVAVAMTMGWPAAVANAQTAQDRLACTADAMRLCASAIPDRARVIACMQRNQAQLGSECRAVMARYAGKSRSDTADKPTIETTVSLEAGQ